MKCENVELIEAAVVCVVLALPIVAAIVAEYGGRAK